MRKAARILVALLFVAAAGDRAQADDGPEQIRITYDAPPSCGSADEFFTQLAARAVVVRANDADATRRSFAVAITSDDSGHVHGVLTIRAGTASSSRALDSTRAAESDRTVGSSAESRGAAESVRTVDGATCEETLGALVVVAALAVTNERPAPTAVVKEPVPVRPPSRTEHWLAAGAGVAQNIGVAPDAVLGLTAFVAYGRARGWQLRGEFARTGEQSAMVTAGASDFRWTAGRVDVRPFAFVRGPFEVAPAIGVQVGALTAHGTTVSSPAGGSRPWVAPSAIGRGAIHFGRFGLELEGSVAFPLVRDRYFVGPDFTVYDVPVATAAVKLALSVQIL